MMWNIQGAFVPVERFLVMEPETVLNYYDGPKLFTFRDSDGGLCLACWSDEDEHHSRFLVVPVTSRIVKQIESGELTLRQALNQPRLWVLDLHSNGELVQARLVDPHTIPDDAQPQVGVCLNVTEKEKTIS